jgi:hypothetical protein
MFFVYAVEIDLSVHLTTLFSLQYNSIEAALLNNLTYQFIRLEENTEPTVQ